MSNRSYPLNSAGPSPSATKAPLAPANHTLGHTDARDDTPHGSGYPPRDVVRLPPAVMPKRGKKTQTHCTYWLRTGNCRYKERCRYIHEVPDVDTLNQYGIKRVSNRCWEELERDRENTDSLSGMTCRSATDEPDEAIAMTMTPEEDSMDTEIKRIETPSQDRDYKLDIPLPHDDAIARLVAAGIDMSTPAFEALNANMRELKQQYLDSCTTLLGYVDRNKELQKEKDDWLHEKDNLANDKVKAENRKEEYKESLRNAQTRIGELMREAEEKTVLETRNAELEAQLNQARQQIQADSDIHHQIKGLEEEQLRLTKLNTDLTSTKDALESQAHDMTAKAGEMVEEHAKMETDLDNASSKVSALAKLKDTLTQEKSSLLAELQSGVEALESESKAKATLQDSLHALQEDVRVKTEEVRRLVERNTALQTEKDGQSEAVQKAHQAQQARMETMAMFQEKQEQLTKLQTRLAEQEAASEKQLEELRQEHVKELAKEDEIWKGKLQSCQKAQTKHATTVRDQHSQELASITADNDRKAKDMQTQLDRSRQALDDLYQLFYAQHSNASMKEENLEYIFANTWAVFEDAARSACSQHLRSERKLRAVQKAYERKNQDVEKIDSQKKELGDTNVRLLGESRAKQTTLDKISAEKKKLSTDLQAAQETLAKKDVDIAVLSKAKKQLEKERRELGSRLDVKQALLDKVLTEKENQPSHRIGDNQDTDAVQGELTLVKVRNDELNTRLASVAKENRSLAKEKEDLAIRIGAVESQLAAARGKTANIKAQISVSTQTETEIDNQQQGSVQMRKRYLGLNEIDAIFGAVGPDDEICDESAAYKTEMIERLYNVVLDRRVEVLVDGMVFPRPIQWFQIDTENEEAGPGEAAIEPEELTEAELLSDKPWTLEALHPEDADPPRARWSDAVEEDQTQGGDSTAALSTTDIAAQNSNDDTVDSMAREDMSLPVQQAAPVAPMAHLLSAPSRNAHELALRETARDIQRIARPSWSSREFYVPSVPNKWWSLDQARDTIKNVKPKYSHVCRIMETELGEEVTGGDACSACHENGHECWRYSETGAAQIRAAGVTCARCRACSPSGGCSFTSRYRRPVNAPTPIAAAVNAGPGALHPAPVMSSSLEEVEVRYSNASPAVPSNVSQATVLAPAPVRSPSIAGPSVPQYRQGSISDVRPAVAHSHKAPQPRSEIAIEEGTASARGISIDIPKRKQKGQTDLPTPAPSDHQSPSERGLVTPRSPHHEQQHRLPKRPPPQEDPMSRVPKQPRLMSAREDERRASYSSSSSSSRHQDGRGDEHRDERRDEDRRERRPAPARAATYDSWRPGDRGRR